MSILHIFSLFLFFSSVPFQYQNTIFFSFVIQPTMTLFVWNTEVIALKQPQTSVLTGMITKLLKSRPRSPGAAFSHSKPLQVLSVFFLYLSIKVVGQLRQFLFWSLIHDFYWEIRNNRKRTQAPWCKQNPAPGDLDLYLTAPGRLQ